LLGKRGDKLTRRVKSYFQKPNSSNTFATSSKKVLEIREEEKGVHLCGCWTTLNPLFRPPDLWHTFALHTHSHTHTHTLSLSHTHTCTPIFLKLTCLSHLFDCDNEILAAEKKQFYFTRKNLKLRLPGRVVLVIVKSATGYLLYNVLTIHCISRIKI